MSSARTILLFLPCLLIVTACSDAPRRATIPAQPNETQPADQAPAGIEDATSTTGPDLSIPILDPKPLVWFDGQLKQESKTAEREEANKSHRMADLLKSMGKYDRAEQLYLKAIEADPSWSFPLYQLACNFELAGKHDEAKRNFDKAVELGFDDFPTALSDDELGEIRSLPDFEQQLQMIRKRYIESGQKRVAAPIAIRPDGEPPETGWPAMVLLHGYGDNHFAYLDNAKSWAELGFLAIALPGSVPQREGSFMWSLESVDPTLRDLRAALASPLLKDQIDRKQVHLLGFSQGALHAMLICAKHSDEFQGVVGLSPGGSLAKQLVRAPIDSSQAPARCVFIHGDQEPHAPIVQIWKQACDDAKWQFDAITHEGGHSFPSNWEEIRPNVAKFLRGS